MQLSSSFVAASASVCLENRSSDILLRLSPDHLSLTPASLFVTNPLSLSIAFPRVSRRRSEAAHDKD